MTASMKFKEELTKALMSSSTDLKTKTMSIRVTKNEKGIFDDLSGATGIKRAMLVSAAITHYGELLHGSDVYRELNNYKLYRQNDKSNKDLSISLRVSEEDSKNLDKIAAALDVTKATAVVMIIHKLHDSFCLAETHDYITEQNMI